MNGKQRIEAVLKGEWPDKRPVMLHNFLMAIKESGYSHKEYREDPEIAAKVNIGAAEKYDPDGILIDIDTATLAGAAGVEVDFPLNDPARCHKPLLHNLEDVDILSEVNIAGDKRIRHWLETTRLVKKYFGNEKYIRGNCDQSPFSLASMIRTPAAWMVDLMMEDTAVYKLLDYCASFTSEFVRLMAETGADMVSNGDSPAGPEMISPEQYEIFALPYEKKVTETASELGLPHMLHICGNTDLILDKMVRSGSRALELDYKTDINLVYEHCVKNNIVFSGNIDPTGIIAYGTPTMVEEKLKEILTRYADSPLLIINAGCAIPASTPPQNIFKLIEITRNY